jgi:transposase
MAARIEWIEEGEMVWTEQNRGLYDRRGQRYPSDLTNEEWVILEPQRPVPAGVGRPRHYTRREIMNGIRYVLRYGIPWDAMPKDLPPSSICYDYWRLLSDGGHMERINHHLVMADREKDGREASPTLAIIDAQSIKCDAPQGERGYDAGKKVLGRKRHIAVDSGGRLLAVKITAADVQDQNGGIPLVKRLVRLCPWIKTVVVDSGYKTLFIEAVQAAGNRVVRSSNAQTSPRASCSCPNDGKSSRPSAPSPSRDVSRSIMKPCFTSPLQPCSSLQLHDCSHP